MTIISKGPGYIGIGNSAPGGPPDQKTPDAQSPDMKREAVYIHEKYGIRIKVRTLILLDMGFRGLLTSEKPLGIALSSLKIC
jgi:hypothetical protein